ncbi:Uncharacterised protein [Serratia proteamaculans]|nr:Uncharacterised protein [Serratia proteamaculans]
MYALGAQVIIKDGTAIREIQQSERVRRSLVNSLRDVRHYRRFSSRLSAITQSALLSLTSPSIPLIVRV